MPVDGLEAQDVVPPRCGCWVAHIAIFFVAAIGFWAKHTRSREEGLGRHRPVPLGHEDVRGRPLFALQTPQRARISSPCIGWTLGEPFFATKTSRGS
jgi:hypothetical protein